MQPLTSDSEIDLTPSAEFLPSLYLRSPRIRVLYDSLRDDTVPLIPCSRVASNSASSSSSSRPRSPVCAPPPEPQDVPNTCSLDVAPPSDEQLGLPSAVETAAEDIPIAIKPLALALWKAPQIAVLNGYTRQQVATALGHALNMHRANGHARAVLVLPRVPSYAKVWQQRLEAALDEIKLTTVRGTRRLRNNCLNSLRTEQSPGVVILADKSLKDAASLTEIRQALKENRVVNTWDLVISEVHGGDSTLNLSHSPFRMVADKHARAGLFVSCSNEFAKVRRDQFSKHAVRDFIQTQLPSLSSLSDESVWITCASVKHLTANPQTPTGASIEDCPAVAKKQTRPKPKPAPKSQKLEHLRRKADALVSEIQKSPPVYRQILPKEVDDEDMRIFELVRDVEPVPRSKRVQRSLSTPTNASRTRGGTAAGRLPLQENRKPSKTKREPRISSAFHSNGRVSPSHDVTPVRSHVGRTRQRSLSQDVRSRRSYDRRSVSIVELSDDDDSELEWHTPPSQIIAPPFYSNNSEDDNDSSGEEEWKTAYASRRKTRISKVQGTRSRARRHSARLSSDHERYNRGHQDSVFSSRTRQRRRPSCALDAGDESPDTFPSTNVLDSDTSVLDPSSGSGERISDDRKVLRRQRVSNGRQFDKRLGPCRSLSVENSLHSEEETPTSSPLGTVRRLSCGSSSASNVQCSPNERRNTSFVEILDSDVEVIDVDREVINLCSDSDKDGFEAFSPARNIESKRARRISMQRAQVPTANQESEDDGDVSYGSSLILTGVTKYNPQHDSLTLPERRKYNTWLQLGRKSEARGPEGYDAAIKLYTKCLTLCDEDDHLASRILSLSHETGLLSMKDFPEGRKTSRISKRTRLPRRRLRRLCSTDSSS
ncbi:hypothetical protein FGB62_88g010 [Gracilaria domingensis]|nr:hypothetical protein FGB62_88g010 [Gracilaria domingensis]